MVDVIADMLQEQCITVDKKTSSVHTKTKAHHAALFPMWFLTWRKNDRVAYAVVNGESGKVVSDLPVDLKSFSLGSAGIALILFLILELLFQPTPVVTSYLSLIAAVIMAYSICRSTKLLQEKQTHAKDKGWSEGKTQEGQPPKTGPVNRVLGKWKDLKKNNAHLGGLSLLPIVGIILYIILPVFVIRALLIAALPLGISLYMAWKVSEMQKDIPEKYPLISILIVLVSAILQVAVILISPVNDGWYYLGDTIGIIGLVLAAVGMMRIYNIGTTRPLPKLFDRKEVDRA